mgnify:CR=1 FL=1
MLLQGRKPNKLQPRADFRPEEFRKRIFSHGLPIEWEQTSECPCSQQTGDYGFNFSHNVNTNALIQSRVDCPACKGKGYIYHSKQSIRAIITHAKDNPERFSNLGGSEYSKGLVGLTLLAEHLPAYGDRFTLASSFMLFRETITKSAGNNDSTRYPIQIRTHDLQNGPLSFGVRYMIYSDINGQVNPLNTLSEGVDFSITNDGLIQWINPPLQGVRISIEYYAHPSYLVLDIPHSTRDSRTKNKSPIETHLELPVYCEAGLEFLGER